MLQTCASSDALHMSGPQTWEMRREISMTNSAGFPAHAPRLMTPEGSWIIWGCTNEQVIWD